LQKNPNNFEGLKFSFATSPPPSKNNSKNCIFSKLTFLNKQNHVSPFKPSFRGSLPKAFEPEHVINVQQNYSISSINWDSWNFCLRHYNLEVHSLLENYGKSQFPKNLMFGQKITHFFKKIIYKWDFYTKLKYWPKFWSKIHILVRNQTLNFHR